MSYDVKDVLDKADGLLIITSYHQPNLKRPAVFRFHGKSGKVVDCVGTDNAIAFLAGVEFSHGFRYTSKEFKAMNNVVSFEPNRKPHKRIETNGGVW